MSVSGSTVWTYTFSTPSDGVYTFNFTTSNVADFSGNYVVTGVSGTNSITGTLNPTLSTLSGSADNVINTTAAGFHQGVDSSGIGFTIGGTDYWISAAGHPAAAYLGYASSIYETAASTFTNCFLQGSLILTTSGEIAVEDLNIGDMLPTMSGEEVPIKWIGHQKIFGHFLKKEKSPVCIKAGALGDGLPQRDLHVSAGHSMVVNDVLVDAAQLVNGITIIQDKINDVVDLYHIDLGAHYCIMAEGSWTESYAEADNRNSFNNVEEFYQLYPDHQPEWTDVCLPHVNSFTDPLLPSLLASLVAFIPKTKKTIDADLHLLVDGVRIDSVSCTKDEYTFVVPVGAVEVRLISHVSSPLEIGESLDKRQLGYCIHEIVSSSLGKAEEVSLKPDSSLLSEGFYKAEGNVRRWTNGNALIPDILFAKSTVDVLLIFKGRALAEYLLNKPYHSHKVDFGRKSNVLSQTA
jgi:Hint domain